MRMVIRRLRKLLREPIWCVLFGCLIVGVILGTLAAQETTNELAAAVFGQAWRKTPADTRSFLVTVLSLQLTVMTIVLSLNAPMIQSAANQYSPRLVPYYLKNVPIRRALPVFVLATAYILAAVREIGFAPDDAVRPRMVLSGAVIVVIVAFLVLVWGMIRTYRFMRVELVLELVRRATFAAIARREARRRRLRLAPSASFSPPADATPLGARRSGYLVEVDVRGLARIARKAGVRVRISRAVGDYFDAGEVVGWVSRDGDGPIGARLLRRLAATLLIAPTREADMDPAYGLRILAEVAARALPPITNDPYTARQALQQVRSVLRHLAGTSLGDWNVVDDDGSIRASVMVSELRELISIAIEVPLRCGAGDPEVLHSVLEIALEVGLVAPDAEGRAVAHQLVNRVLEDAIEYGDLRNGRLKRLVAEADVVRASLNEDCPRSDRHARSDWALTRGDDGPPRNQPSP